MTQLLWFYNLSLLEALEASHYPPSDNVAESSDKCDSESSDLCAQYVVTRCSPCKDLLGQFEGILKASPEIICPAYLQACVWEV